jgi:DNA-binding transcriptional MerR regulator
MPTAVDSYSSKRAAALAGVTFRKLDYWSRTGVLPDTAAGSGSRRRFSSDEVLLMAIVEEAQSADNGATSCLDAFREHRDQLLDMLADQVQLLALIGGRFVNVASTTELVEQVAKAPAGTASWTMIDVDAVRARVNARRADAASLALQVDPS